MVTGLRDDVRSHVILTEDEAYFASGAIRRMTQSRERRLVEIGDEHSGVLIMKVDHQRLPVELHIVDDDGATIVDLTKDDALCLADMLWGAHRSTMTFHGMTSISGTIRRVDQSVEEQVIVPRPDGPAARDARIVGDVKRRIRGQEPETKT